jgi:hypothetical protein
MPYYLVVYCIPIPPAPLYTLPVYQFFISVNTCLLLTFKPKCHVSKTMYYKAIS